MPGLPGDQEENDNRYTPMVHMKYYSKEIPKAKVLPISRVVSKISDYLVITLVVLLYTL